MTEIHDTNTITRLLHLPIGLAATKAAKNVFLLNIQKNASRIKWYKFTVEDISWKMPVFHL